MNAPTNSRPVPFAPLFGMLAAVLVAGGAGLVFIRLHDLPTHTLWRPLNCHTPLFMFVAMGASLLVMKGHRRSARGVAAIPLGVAGVFGWFAMRAVDASVRGIVDAEQRAELPAHVLREQLVPVGMTTFIALGLLGTTWWVTRRGQ